MKNFLYPGMGAGVVGRAAAWSPGQMGRRAHRGIRQRRPRPRQPHAGASGARPGRPISGARRLNGGQSWRLSVGERSRQLDQFAGDGDGRRLRDPGSIHGGARRLYQHGADRRLSRRRQARGQLPDRTAGRPRRAPDRQRSGEPAPAQSDQRVPLPQRVGHDDRLRTLRRQSRRRRGADGRLRRASDGGRGARPAARPRGQLFSRNRARRRQRGRRNPLRARRARSTDPRHPIERPGPRDQLSANRRCSAWAAAGDVSLCPGRYAAVRAGAGMAARARCIRAARHW